MIKHIVIVLDNCCPSYCHYENTINSKLISLSDLKQGIKFAMKENLSIQFLLPDYPLAKEYWGAMNEIDSITYTSSTCEDAFALQHSDVIIFNDWSSINSFDFSKEKIYVLRTTREDFYARVNSLERMVSKVDRLNVIITNPHGFVPEEIPTYQEALEKLSMLLFSEYIKSHAIQANLLTDRILLEKMNNCNAGAENITLMPNGKFYACPAFYYSGYSELGTLDKGVDIINPQLYRLENAPICSICDAYHCKRCIWLNQSLTHERNTPSKEQCLMAHVERNSAANLLSKIRTLGDSVPDKVIPTIKYLDPFEKLINHYE